MERLEDRLLLSTIFEEQWPRNETPDTAFPLNLNWGGPNEYTGPQLDAADNDFFLFSTLRPPESGDTATLKVLNAGNFPLVITIQYWDGFQFQDVSNQGRISFPGDVVVDLGGLPATIFLLGVQPGIGFSGLMDYSVTLDVPPILRDQFDAASPNNTFGTATDLGTASGFQFVELTTHDMADRDFFRFTLAAPGTEEHFFAIEFEHFTTTDLGLALYDDAGTLLDISIGPSNRHEVSLANLPPGAYRLEVFGDGGGSVTNPGYLLSSNAPRLVQADGLEPNDTFTAPHDLGTVAGVVRRGAPSIQTPASGFLSIHSADDLDVFRFTINQTGGGDDFVGIDFDHSAGDLDLLLFSGTASPFLLDASVGVTNSERISLEGLPAATYHAVVLGALGSVNPSYALTIRGPGGAVAADQFDAEFSNDNRNRATLLGPVGGLRVLAAPETLLSIQAGDEDWYAFELTEPAAPGHFAAIAFSHALGDLDLELYRGDSTRLGSSSGVGDGEFLSLAGLAPGTYYLRVFGFAGATNPQYSLAINGSGPDRHDETSPNDSAATATDLRGVGGRFQEIGLSIHNAADQDWFRFETSATAAAGNFVSIDFEHVRGDLDLFLFDESGTQPLASSTGVEDGERISLTDVNLPGGRGALPAGTYTVSVIGFGGDTNPLYNLNIVAPTSGGVDRFDRGGTSNNSRATAVNLSAMAGHDGVPGGLVVLSDPEEPLSIHPAGDEDWFRIAITGQETFSHFAAIGLDHTQGDLDLELYFANEPVPVRRSVGVGGTHFINLANLTPSDSYYLRVFGFDDGSGPDANPAYSLVVNLPESASGDWSEADNSGGAADNNARPRATDLGAVDRIVQRENLSIHDGSDEDWFRFQTLGAGQHGHAAAIAFDHLLGDLELELYDQTGALLRRSATVNDSETISLDGLPAATYFVRIAGRDLGAGRASNPQYSLRIDAPHGPAGDYAEDNDTAATAHDLREVQGPRTFDPLSIHASGDDDWFRFATTATAVDGNAVAISFDPRLGDLDLVLYDSTGTQVLGQSRTAQGSERIALDEVAVPGSRLTAGTYLVQVLGHNGDTHPRYFLTIDAPNAELPPDIAEENDTSATAANLQEIRGTARFTGLSIDQPNDDDWFVFQTAGIGVEGHQVEIVFDHTQGDLDLKLLAADGTTMLGESTGVSNREVVSLGGLASGTYFVRVSGSGGATQPAYTLSIAAPQQLEPDFAEGATGNDQRTQAYNLRSIEGTLALGGLSIHTAADQDWFQFQLPRNTTPGQSLRIDFNHSEGNLKLELFRGGESVAIAMSDGPGNSEEIALSEPDGDSLPAGTYLVRVTGSGGATNPNYTLTIASSAAVVPDRYEPNDSLATAYDLRALSQLARSAAPSSRFFHFGFGGFDPFGFGGIGGGFDPFGFGGFGGFDPFGFGGFGGGFDPFGGFGTLSHPGFDVFGGLGGFDPFGGFGSLAHPGFDVFGGLGGFDPFGGGGNFAAFDAQLDLFGNPFAGLDVPVGPGLGVANLVAMEFSFTNQFNNFAAQGAINLARLIPNVPGALEAVGFGGPFLTNALNGALQANAGLIGNIQANSIITSNAIAQFSSIFRGQGGASSAATIGDLSLEAGDPDYFRFELTQPGLEGQFVSIGFDHDQGDLRLSLLAWSGNPADAPDVLDVSDGQGDSESLNLTGLPVGVYYLLVEGATASTSNPDYSLVVSSTPESATTGDLAESNNTSATAHDLREVEGVRVLSGLSIHQPGDEDWFQFELTTPTSSAASHFVEIEFDQDQGDLDLALFRAGQSTPLATAAGTGNSERIALMSGSGGPLAAGTYQVRVVGYASATNPSYTLTLSTPAGPIAPDPLEPNNAPAHAANLNDRADHLGPDRITGLSIHSGDTDLFEFTIPAGRTASDAHALGIEFDRNRGDLNLELLNSAGSTVLRTPDTSGTDNEIISLAGLAAGTYLARVRGAGGAVENRYTLHVDAPLDAGQTRDDWTVMVYMTASDLARFAFEDVNEMEQAATLLPGRANLVVLYDQSALETQFATGGGTQGAWGTSGRAVIRPDTDPDVIATRFDRSIGEKNTGNPSSLVEFVTWAAGVAPADHYALILWDHGQGVEGFNFDNADGAPTDPMTASELTSALQQLAAGASLRPDLLAFDSCNMAMTELFDRFGAFADVVVASQENIAGTGFAYDDIFGPLRANPAIVTAESLASAFVASFANQYRGNAEGADTLSAARSTGAAALANALRSFTTAALDPGVTTAQFDALRDARDSATSFLGHPEYRDLGQLMSFAAGATTLPAAIRNAAQSVVDALSGVIVAKTSDQRDTSGLSILLPAHGEPVSGNYGPEFADFLTVTGWDDFLQQFVSGATARPASLDPDFAEANEFARRATELHALSGSGHALANLSLHNRVDRDWFRFGTAAAGGTGDRVRVQRDSAGGAWRLALHDASGTQLDASTNVGTSITLSLSGRPAGTYLLLVQSTDGTIVPRYTLEVDAPAAALAGDWAGSNTSAAKALGLGVVSSDAVFAGLVIEPGSTDYFTFQTPRNVQGGSTRGTVQVISTTGRALTVGLAGGQNPAMSMTATGMVELEYDTGTALDYQLSVQGASGDTYLVQFVADTPAVADTTPPTLQNVPGSRTVEVVGRVSTPVTYPPPTASDAVDPSPTVTCTPPSGVLFQYGRTTVMCTARDAAGNTSAPAPFDVIVQDSIGPRIEALELVDDGKKITSFEFTVSEELLDSRAGREATDPLNFGVASASGKDKQFGTADDKLVSLGRALYDARSNLIRLVPAKPLSMHRLYFISVGGDGPLTDLVGNHLDGNRNGTNGDPYQTLVGRGTKLSFTEADGDRGSLALKKGGVLELRLVPGAAGPDVEILGALAGSSALSGKVKKAKTGNGIVTVKSITGAQNVDRAKLVACGGPIVPPCLAVGNISPASASIKAAIVDTLLDSGEGLLSTVPR